MYIAFFDSGLGGLSVLHEAMRLMPQEHFVYYADTANVPYGNKSREQVKDFVFEAVEQLLKKYPLKALVVACNTATSIAINELRERYSFTIVGMEPAVKPAIEKYEKQQLRVLVLATELTLKEDKYHQLLSKIDQRKLADALPMPGLVQLCEQLQFDEESVRTYLLEKMHHIQWNEYGGVVLGCTHFPFFRKQMRNFFPEHIEIMDGNLGTVRHLQQLLSKQGMLQLEGTGSVRFYSSRPGDEEAIRMQKALDYYHSKA